MKIDHFLWKIHSLIRLQSHPTVCAKYWRTGACQMKSAWRLSRTNSKMPDSWLRRLTENTTRLNQFPIFFSQNKPFTCGSPFGHKADVWQNPPWFGFLMMSVILFNPLSYKMPLQSLILNPFLNAILNGLWLFLNVLFIISRDFLGSSCFVLFHYFFTLLWSRLMSFCFCVLFL